MNTTKTIEPLTITTDQLGRAAALLMIADVPMNAIGNTGVGKTTAIVDLIASLNAEATDGGESYRLWKPSLVGMPPEDIGGLPCIAEADGQSVTRYAAHANLPWSHLSPNARGIVFFDEIDEATMGMQAMASQLILERSVHSYRFADGTWVCSAMNGRSDIAGKPLLKKLRSRVCHLHVRNTGDEGRDSFLRWAGGNDVSATIKAFAAFSPWHDDVVHTEYAVDCPRTRVMAGRVYEAAQQAEFEVDDILPAIICGLVGRIKGTELLGFFDVAKSVPPLEVILADPKNAPLPADRGAQYYVAMRLADASPAGALPEASLALAYLARFDAPECVAYAVTQLLVKTPALATTNIYQAWYSKNSAILTIK